jgi:hypothetical protein
MTRIGAPTSKERRHPKVSLSSKQTRAPPARHSRCCNRPHPASHCTRATVCSTPLPSLPRLLSSTRCRPTARPAVPSSCPSFAAPHCCTFVSSFGPIRPTASSFVGCVPVLLRCCGTSTLLSFRFRARAHLMHACAPSILRSPTPRNRNRN